MRYLLVSIDNANAPDVAHVVSEFYLGYGVDDADAPGVHVRELAADVSAELERERTQNLALTAIDEAACALIGLLRHALPDGVEAKGIDFAPYRRYRAARAALSTQEESK